MVRSLLVVHPAGALAREDKCGLRAPGGRGHRAGPTRRQDRRRSRALRDVLTALMDAHPAAIRTRDDTHRTPREVLSANRDVTRNRQGHLDPHPLLELLTKHKDQMPQENEPRAHAEGTAPSSNTAALPHDQNATQNTTPPCHANTTPPPTTSRRRYHHYRDYSAHSLGDGVVPVQHTTRSGPQLHHVVPVTPSPHGDPRTC